VHRSIPCIVFGIASGIATYGQPPSAETILDRARETFTDAKSLEVRAVTVTTITGVDFEQTQRSGLLIASEQPGKYRIEPRGTAGQTIVSDGEQSLTYVSYMKQYTKAPVSSSFAEALLGSPAAPLAGMNNGRAVGSATVTGEEELQVDGASRRCYVVEIKSPRDSGFAKVWVDRESFLILKSITTQHVENWPPNGGPADMTTAITVRTAKVNQALPSDMFLFVPPATAKLVNNLEFPGKMQKSDLEGKAATDFTLRDLSNHDVRLSALRGKTVLLDFWATWCAPCREEIPVLQKLQRDNSDLMVVGIDVGEDAKVVEKFVKDQGISYQILLAGQNAMLKDYGVRSYPTVLIIDREGIIRDSLIGYGTGSESHLLAALMAAGKPFSGSPAGAAPRMKEGKPAPVQAEVEANSRSLDRPPVPGMGETLTAEAAYREGMRLIRNKKTSEGIAMLGKAIAMKPDWAQAYMARGRQQYQEKRYVEALRDFDAAIRLEPDNPTWYGSRGLAYSYSGQHERAIEDYTREMEMAPRASSAPYNNRGWAYVDLGQPEKALPDLTTAIAMSPDYQKAFENRAKAYIALKEWPSAIADLTAAIQINATAWDYEQRAAAKRATNDERGAEEDSRKAKELHAPPPQIPQ
jgi:thiol-disulfide isomerase/thioredoxin/outer membrane lipoprotein-sorting protein/Flp pilus assembly protein TadD